MRLDEYGRCGMNRIWVALLTCVMMVCTFMGLSNIITAGGWQWHMIGFPVMISAGMMVVILVAANHKVASGVGSIGVGLVIWLCYLTGLTGGGVLPTPSALSNLVTHLGDAIAALPNYGRPAPNPDLFVPLGIVGLGPMAILAFFLAVNLRSPISAGIPALGCWIVFLSGGPERGLGWALASTASYLMLLAISDKKGKPARFRAIAVPVVALSAVIGVVGSYVLPMVPTWGQSQDLLDFWNDTYTDNTGINVDGPIRVADSLRTQSSVLLFHTQGETGEPMKMGTLDEFTGQSWVASNRGRARPYREGTLVWYQNAGSDSPGSGWSEGTDVTVRIDQLSGVIVPSGDGPRSISQSNGLTLSFDAGSDTFRSRTSMLDEGDSYVTHTMVLDRSVLRAIRAPIRYSLLDPNLVAHADEIAALTTQVIGDALTQDDILTAIETYLRGPGFTYTLNPTWNNQGDPVWDFLQAKQGYCVHYATAMAVMAMSVGITMQVSVGYLPGMVESDDWRGVTGSRAHMWPEAYFSGVGWVRYEPTPAIQSGDIAVGPVGVASEEEVEEQVPADQVSQNTLPEITAAPVANPVGTQTGSIDWLLICEVVGSVIGAGLLVGLILAVYVRLYTPERAWRRILGVGMNKGLLTDAMSVRTAADVLSRRLGPSCPPDLAVLRDYLEVSRYAPADAGPQKIPGRRLWKLKRGIARQLRR